MRQGLIESATVILLRRRTNLEVLLLRRNRDLVFHGGDWVFPGGRVDAEDFRATPLETAKQAAVREAKEEADLDVAVGQLHSFGHWTTPVVRPRRYATWFFLAEADGNARPDGSECLEARWWDLGEALEARARGEIGLPPPTFVSLTRLREANPVRILEAAHEERIVPKIVSIPGGECALYNGDAGYLDADVERTGARHRAWYLESGWRYERNL